MRVRQCVCIAKYALMSQRLELNLECKWVLVAAVAAGLKRLQAVAVAPPTFSVAPHVLLVESDAVKGWKLDTI